MRELTEEELGLVAGGDGQTPPPDGEDEKVILVTARRRRTPGHDTDNFAKTLAWAQMSLAQRVEAAGERANDEVNFDVEPSAPDMEASWTLARDIALVLGTLVTALFGAAEHYANNEQRERDNLYKSGYRDDEIVLFGETPDGLKFKGQDTTDDGRPDIYWYDSNGNGIPNVRVHQSKPGVWTFENLNNGDVRHVTRT